MEFDISTTNNEKFTIDIEYGETIIFIGANGSGKSRIAINIEETLGASAHRISAHRALNLNDNVSKISEETAQRKLRFGSENKDVSIRNRNYFRWKAQASNILLNDFDAVVQLLFAEQYNVVLNHYKLCKSKKDINHNSISTKFEKLESIWKDLIPHRELIITGDNIKVKIPDSEYTYNASDMSDGERAIFYLIGQVLVATENSIIIIDEPELHIHRSIINSLWDHLESARKDCAFIFITHDIEFASSRIAKKIVIKEYQSGGPKWNLELINEDTGFSEEFTTLILGGRKPILFVEGATNSLDKALYRTIYPEWTIMPCGSCQDVIHAVKTFRTNKKINNIHCAGIIDSDDRDSDEVEHLKKMGIIVIPVSEIENIFLIPVVSEHIALADHCNKAEIKQKLESILNGIIELAENKNNVNDKIMRYCRRRIDRFLKKIDLSNTKSIGDINDMCINEIKSLDINLISEDYKIKLDTAIKNKDINSLLSIFDNKGMLAMAGHVLTGKNKKSFESWLIRILTNEPNNSIILAIRNILPSIATTPSICDKP